MEARAITIAILAMGGEGGGVLADWIADLAEHGGYLAQVTSVPGVAQRTGSTIYYVELFPEAVARSAGQDPVLALMPVPGQLDVVIASELMEAGRAVQRGFVTPDRTTLIASTHRVYSMTERTALGDGRVDATVLLEGARAAAKHLVHADFDAMARNSDSVISAVLFGALAATQALPFARQQFEEAIRRGGVGVDASAAAFATAFESAAAPRAATAVPSGSKPICDPAQISPLTAGGWASARAELQLRSSIPAVSDVADRILRDFPAPVHEILLAGVRKLEDYQDRRYAAEYLDRLAPVRDADHGSFPLLREAARHLALWMSYEDAIRVADLKTRPGRFERIRSEVRAAPGQVVRIHDYLYPRIGELSDIMPAPLGRWLLSTAWARRPVEWLTRKGKVLQTTSLLGYLKLYLLARCRRWRRRTLRFVREQQRISEWLAMLPPLATEDYALACEVAECPRLLKGYGDTHVRGSASFDSMMATLPMVRSRDDAAAQFRRLREAALADESGEKLAEMLKSTPESAERQRRGAE